MGSIVRCKRISVDCVLNDPVDVKCGGPMYLGFDFAIDANLVAEMKEFIINSLVEENIPVERIYIGNEEFYLSSNSIFDETKIRESIKKNAGMIISQENSLRRVR